MKSIQNYINKNETDALMIKNKSKNTQRDFVPIYQILKNR